MTVRIDLHLHTLSADKKDNGFDFSMAWLKQYVKEANLDAIAITNHNTFSEEQFNDIAASIECAVLPGVELSLKNGHVNIVLDNTGENVHLLAQATARLNLGATAGLAMSDFKEIFSWVREAVMIFEYSKSNPLGIDEEFQDPFFDGYTFVRGVGSQLKFQKALMINDEYCPVLFSDGHATDIDPDAARNSIPKLMLKNTYVQMETFNFPQLLSELKIRSHIQVTADGFPDTFQIDVDNHPVAVSTKLNLVVGRRGSGKTYFLDHIREQYSGEDAEVAYIRQFKSTEDTQKFLKQESKNIAQETRKRFVARYESELDSIVEFYKTSFEDRMDSYLGSVRRFAQEVTSSKTAKQVRLFSEIAFDIGSLNQHQKTLRKMKEVIEANGFWSFVPQPERDVYFQSFLSAYREARAILLKKEVSNEIKKEANKIIDDVKTIVNKHTAITAADDIDFIAYFSHFEEEKQLLRFVEKVVAEPLEKTIPRYAFKVQVVKSKWTNASEFQSTAPIQGKVAVNDELVKPYLKGEYQLFLENLFGTKFQGYFTLASGFDLSRYLFHLKVELLTETGAKASGGQQVALGLMMKLDDAKKSDIVLVDEPEASLDNVFIKDGLIPKLREISKNTPVFVITHNSTLGALLDPDRLIIAKFDSKSKQYILLTGDFHAKKVENEAGLKVGSYDDFVDAMEAGIETYRKKGEQYASLKD